VQVVKEMSEGAIVIDIRGDEQQRRDGLIPGALVVRRNVLEWRCDPQSEWRDARIKSYDQRLIIVCNEGYQSSLAAANLQMLGMKNATDMEGGFQQWRKAGLPVQSGTRISPLSTLFKTLLSKFKSYPRNGAFCLVRLNESPGSPPSVVQLVFGDGTPKKALLTALIVGSILTAINHGDTILAGHWPPMIKMLLTYLTPYCVTTWGAMIGKRSQWKRDATEPK
jgi:rhodanese-related sulfurtransferase